MTMTTLKRNARIKLTVSTLLMALFLVFAILFTSNSYLDAAPPSYDIVYIEEGGNAETQVEIDEEADKALDGQAVTEGSPFYPF